MLCQSWHSTTFQQWLARWYFIYIYSYNKTLVEKVTPTFLKKKTQKTIQSHTTLYKIYIIKRIREKSLTIFFYNVEIKISSSEICLHFQVDSNFLCLVFIDKNFTCYRCMLKTRNPFDIVFKYILLRYYSTTVQVHIVKKKIILCDLNKLDSP